MNNPLLAYLALQAGSVEAVQSILAIRPWPILPRVAPEPSAVDGVWGPRTHRSWLYASEILWQAVCRAEGWSYSGIAVTHPSLHETSRQPAKLRGILHWPVGRWTANTLAGLWERNAASPQGTSCHVGIDEREVVWYAPPHLRVRHAARHNAGTLGVDICVPCTVGDRSNAEARGVYAGDAPGGLLRLHPDVAARVAGLVETLTIMGVIRSVTDHADVDPGRKIDCIVWRPALEEAGVKGDWR